MDCVSKHALLVVDEGSLGGSATRVPIKLVPLGRGVFRKRLSLKTRAIFVRNVFYKGNVDFGLA